MNKHYKFILDNLVKEMSKLPYVYGIILFGSEIYGKAREDSDIDIAVITKGLNEKQEIAILGFSSEKFEVSLFNKLPLIVQFRIVKDGRILYLKDERYFKEIKYDLIRKYLDFSCYINNFYRRAIKNV